MLYVFNVVLVKSTYGNFLLLRYTFGGLNSGWERFWCDVIYLIVFSKMILFYDPQIRLKSCCLVAVCPNRSRKELFLPKSGTFRDSDSKSGLEQSHMTSFRAIIKS